jgi:hypothetical protein
MKKLKTVVLPVARMAAPLLAVFALTACEEEKSEPLPDLPPIEIPKDVPGLYSGSLPCDDCTSRMVRMALGEDSSVEAIQLVLRDTMETDSLKGTYAVTDSTIKVSLEGDKGHWNFKRAKFGNLQYMTAAGTVYEDKDGMKSELIRIFKVKPKTIAKDTAKDAAKDTANVATKDSVVADTVKKEEQPKE